MKRILISAAATATLAVGSLAAAVLAPATAGANTNNLTIVNSATYDYPSAVFTQTACLDGSFVANLDVGEHVTTTITTDVDHTVGFIQGSDADCSGAPDYSQVVNIPESIDVTVGLIWGETREAVQWFDDDACYDGTGRITLRSGGFLAGSVDMMGTVEGVRDVIIGDVVLGGQGTVELPAGTVISNVTITSAGNPDDTIVSLGDVTVTANGDLQVYLAGGNDGAIGAFSYTVAGEPCPVTTTTAPAAAAAASATPAFTG